MFMPKDIQLDNRLTVISEFVTKNSVAADIGCDHGYLICSLVKTGRIKHGFACEANLGPLENAKKTIEENCLSNSIDTVLTNGLTDLPYSAIDTFIIAGMGGDLISEILLSHAWTRDNRFDFILQPMTKAENLRQTIYKNGFTITKEQAVISDNKVYTVILSKYTKRIYDTDPISCYTGCLFDNDDFPSRLYLEQTAKRLEKKSKGLFMAKNPENAKKYADLASEIRERIKLKWQINQI